MSHVTLDSNVSGAFFTRKGVLHTGLIAGLIGGLAEVCWILLYSQFSAEQATNVASAISQTALPSLTLGGLSATLGIVIHMGLAIGLGIGTAFLLRHFAPFKKGSLAEFSSVVALLIGVWAVNFLIVLPAINPDFIALVPLWSGFVSKLAFGLCAAAVFWKMSK